MFAIFLLPKRNLKKNPIRTGSYRITGAQEGTRTPTPLTELAPEASASTNFATWATGDILCEDAPKVKQFFAYAVLLF